MTAKEIKFIDKSDMMAKKQTTYRVSLINSPA